MRVTGWGSEEGLVEKLCWEWGVQGERDVDEKMIHRNRGDPVNRGMFINSSEY